MVYKDYPVQAATIIQHGINQLRDLFKRRKRTIADYYHRSKGISTKSNKTVSRNFSGLQKQLHPCSASNATNQAYYVLAAVLKTYVIDAQQSSAYNNYPF